MIKLQRYISSVILKAICAVLFVILGLDLLSVLVEELADLRGDYQFPQAMQFLLLTAPMRFYEFLPSAILIGCLAGLGSLATNSELVVIRGAGVNLFHLIWFVMRPALLFMALGLVLSEFVAPKTEQIAQSNRAIAMYGGQDTVSGSGLWHREGNQFMHFNAVQPNGALHGITIFEFDTDYNLRHSWYAEKALYSGDRWRLESVSKNTVTPAMVETKQWSSVPWKTSLTPKLLNVLTLDADSLSIVGLKSYIAYLKEQGLDSREYQLSFWNKCLRPLATLSLVLVAISFVMGPLREVTIGFRIFVGVVVGVGFRTLQDLMAPASLVYGFDPMWAVLGPILLCGLTGLLLLRRVF